jgi:hypothetical protein
MERNSHAFGRSLISNALLFPRIYFYLLQSFQDLIGQANVNDRDIQRHNRDDKHATNNKFHENLP